MSTRKEEFVADARRANRMIWDALAMLRSLQKEWHALDYLNTLGTVDGLPSDVVGAVVFATTDAFDAALTAGHATNMARLL